jgi:hypothetical protein
MSSNGGVARRLLLRLDAGLLVGVGGAVSEPSDQQLGDATSISRDSAPV